MLAIRLPSDIEDRLEVLAARTGRTKTFYAREAIVRYLQEIEADYSNDRIKGPQEQRLSEQDQERPKDV